MSKHEMDQKYIVISTVLGTGSYATVKLGMVKDSRAKVAVKVYEKHKLMDNEMRKRNCVQEIVNLRKINHP